MNKRLLPIVFPGVNAVAICDCGCTAFMVGIEFDPAGNNYIRCVQCDECGKQLAVGAIDDDTRQAIELGRRLREKRLARDESLREAAKRLGLSAAELSALEHGRGGLAAWNHPFAIAAFLEVSPGADMTESPKRIQRKENTE